MASGDTLLVVPAGAFVPTATAAAQMTALAGASSPAERFTRLAFDDTTTEYADCLLTLPATYGGGGLTIRIENGASATTSTYTLGAAIRRIEDDAEDLDTTAHTYDFNDSSAITPPSAVGEVGYDNITFTSGADMDSLAAGERFVLRLRRTTGGTSGDVFVYSVEIRET